MKQKHVDKRIRAEQELLAHSSSRISSGPGHQFSLLPPPLSPRPGLLLVLRDAPLTQRLHRLLKPANPLAQVIQIFFFNTIPGLVPGLGVGSPQELETISLFLRDQGKDRQKLFSKASGQAFQIFQVMQFRLVPGEDEEQVMIEVFHGLVKLEGCPFVVFSRQEIREPRVCLFRDFEPALEIRFRLA